MRIKRKDYHSTAFVTIDTVRALSDEIGYAQAQGVLKKIARYLKNAGLKEYGLQTYTYRYSEYIFAVTVHTKDKKRIDAFLNTIAARLLEPWIYGSMAIRVEGHCFLMKYPEHFSDVSELITKMDIISEKVTDHHEVVYDIDSVDFGNFREVQNFDLMARNNLDRKTSVIKYQPVLSRVYRINYTSDVLCFFMDEYGNEIDMRGHVPDVRVTQSLMDTDEYVYRNACRALAFWNAGDKNGKYRAIVGMSQGEISKNDFIRRIKKILREEKSEASWITIKLTETTITTMNSVAERNLRLLGDMKCSIIVDKFGSGYGDLDRILALPVVQINLDHSILVHARNSGKMKIVAKGIVNLFHDISLFVGATEISSQEDRMIADELGCDFLVGDYLGVPVKDSSFVKTIDDYFEEG
jgi:EAL domain-containing protein (putative c-di-GMP-specific phosphodiesterase class I)